VRCVTVRNPPLAGSLETQAWCLSINADQVGLFMVDSFSEQMTPSSGSKSELCNQESRPLVKVIDPPTSSRADDRLAPSGALEGADVSPWVTKVRLKGGGDSWHGHSLWETVNWEDRYVRLVRAARDAIFLISPEGTILSLNPAFEAITGWPRSRWLGESLSTLLHPDDVSISQKAFRRCADKEEVPMFETRVRRRTGGYAVLEWLITGQVANGATIAVLGIARDVTGQRQMEQELRRAEEQLRHAQKMDALGRMAGGVAHDFNNLLTIILGFSEILLKGIGEENANRESVAQILRAGERGAYLTRQLLAFSRKQALEAKVLNLNTVVIEAEGMLQRLLGEQFDLSLVLEPSLNRVKADARQLEHVIFNLANNARDAMPGGGIIELRTRNVAELPASVSSSGTLPAGPFVAVSLTDTGCGMNKSTKARLFEPFFSTKGPGMGTGLGLATAYGVVKQSGGYIQVESEPGRGTTVTIYLPVTTEELPTEEHFAVTPSLLGSGETVLVAEDNDAVRSLACRVLRAGGYQVVEASDGTEAEEVCARHRGPIHLLVTDLVMPRVGGQKLAERLSVPRPEMRVLFMSGHPADADVGPGLAESAGAFLAKPFTPNVLLKKARELLGRHG
jgi:two-component system, cell cycle sensor histidine kinase and response regulator CckA